MWLVTRIGFFNIVEQDSDKEKGLLTIKARSKEDLKNFSKYVEICSDIQESSVADYRFRIKVVRSKVMWAISLLVQEINYGKTKPAIMEDFPERSGIYFGVWDALYQIQCLKENT